MTAPAPTRPLVTSTLLLAAFAAAVAVRVAVAGAAGASSRSAGLVFASVLAAAAAVAGARARIDRRVVAVGLVGAAVLVAPAAVHVGGPSLSLPAAGFPMWALLTTVVATAEEAFLRGALYDAVARRRSSDTAIVVAAVAFALLHVPLYGWHVVPLDFAVGVVLGVMRLAAGSWLAPAIGHVGADLIGWWLL